MVPLYVHCLGLNFKGYNYYCNVPWPKSKWIYKRLFSQIWLIHKLQLHVDCNYFFTVKHHNLVWRTLSYFQGGNPRAPVWNPAHYKLLFQYVFNQCNRTQALKQLFQLGTGEQKSVAVIDAGCSTATEATAEISHLFGYSQVSDHYISYNLECAIIVKWV